MVVGFVGVLQLLFLLLHFLHDFLGFGVLLDHDEGHADVGQDDGLHVQDFVPLFFDERFVQLYGFLLLFFHEKYVGHVESPGFVFEAELRTLLEYLLHERVVFLFPLDFALAHEDRHELLHGFVLVLQVAFDGFVVPGKSGIVDLFGQLAQHVDVLLADVVEFLLGLLCTRLLQNQCVYLLILVLGQTLEGKVCVFSQNVGCQVILTLLAVEQQQIGECLRGEGRIVEEEVQLLEAFLRSVVHPHQRLVVQGHRVDLVFVSRRHVH